jgi:PAS domain S-box-containing protein
MGLFDFIGSRDKISKGGEAESVAKEAASEPAPKAAMPLPSVLPKPAVPAVPAPAAAAPVPVSPAVPAVQPAPAPSAQALAGGKARDIAIYRQLMEGLYDALLIVDPSGHVIAQNTRAAEYFCWDVADMWHIELQVLIPAMTLTALTKIRQHVESGRFAVVQATCMRKDGATFAAEVAVRVIRFMNDADLVFTIRNIERRKVAQRRHLMELSAVQQSAAAMAICDAAGSLRYFNAALLKMWGYDDEAQLANVALCALFEEPDLAGALLAKPQETGTWSGRLSAHHRGGHSFTVAAASSVVRNAEGQVEHLVLTFIDLSGLRPATGALRLRQAPSAL